MQGEAGLRSNLLPVFLIVLIFAVVTTAGVVHKGFTYDEGNHFNYGNQLVFGHSSVRPLNSVMPITAFNSLLFAATGSTLVGRFATVLFSMIVAIYLFAWGSRLYGRRAGYLALLLYCFCPNVLAHSAFITTDVYAAGTILIALYHFWDFLNRPDLRRALLSGAALGLAQIAKFTNVALYPLFVVLAFLFWLGPGRASLGRWRSFPLLALVLLALSILVIDAACLFQGLFVPFAGFTMRSEVFRAIQQHFPALGQVPVPVAYSYLQGLDWVLSDSQTGASTPLLYLFGELRDPTKGEYFKGYYFFVSLFKIPLATQLLLAVALLYLLVKPRGYHLMRNEIFIFLPVLFYSWFFNFYVHTQVGLRHFMVVLPLLYVFTGSIMAIGGLGGSKGRLLLMTVAVYMLFSAGRYYPHFLSYTNELVWDKTKAYRIFADSNLAWGGDEYFLNKFLAENPAALFDPREPTPGLIVVGLNEVVGINYPETYRWLRENFEPVDVVAGSYLVYQIEPPGLDRVSAAARE